MILPIEKYGSGKLRIAAHKVAVTPELAALAESMLETMYRAKGVGLAAEQVGRDEALCVIDVPLSCEDDEETRSFNARTAQPLVMFNPEIVAASGEQTGREGCLSLPGISENVVRPATIKIRFLDEDFKEHEETFTGFQARIVQHEYDHLEGHVFTDRISPIRKTFTRNKLMAIAKGKVGARYKYRRN